MLIDNEMKLERVAVARRNDGAASGRRYASSQHVASVNENA
jgi:hypothetical protein